ncbi:MAG: class I SAM-dependent methyltransferase [Candidatus Hodarchaeota archaeon]
MDINDSSNSNDQIKNILYELELISSKKALDVATGEGVFIKLLMKTLKKYQLFTGIDIYQKSLNKAVKSFKRNFNTFINMNAENLEFKDNTFDLGSISESLHHLNNPIKVLREIKRVLMPNRFLILQESFSDSDQSSSQISDVLIHEFIAKIDILRNVYHHGFYSRKELVKMIEEAGFGDIKVYISQSPLKCVLCKYIDICQDSMSKRMMNIGLRAINSSLKKGRDLSQYNDLKIEAKNIKNKIHENGYSPAAVVFIFAKSISH